ncbi:MAG: DUF4476 domain-containing protein [Chitinophagaceae bacterium]|nr:DUF4476 domain-containing protein [Chitinophagaceae bacterium]
MRQPYSHGYAFFRYAEDALRRENFENSRLAIAKQSGERNAFSAQQVKEIVRLFDFEKNKLELAKAAYANTIDKKNYFVIYDAFSFSRSKEGWQCGGSSRKK